MDLNVEFRGLDGSRTNNGSENTPLCRWFNLGVVVRWLLKKASNMMTVYAAYLLVQWRIQQT
ncbi:hypothetical protein [Alicyclobacillus sp. TC]|uniref:hypothetical protein n=1 Tax=Alicyclobacillus sp. TC TaxID=2606450 RepID=UPI001EE3E6CC|nr:hypothetical protein [Alicyclobacillus sp. TC]